MTAKTTDIQHNVQQFAILDSDIFEIILRPQMDITSLHCAITHYT